MKPIIVLFVFFICCYFGFLVDQSIIAWLLDKCPGSEWLEIIEVFLWVVIICISFSLIISVSFGVAGLVSIVIKINPVKPYSPTPYPAKSKWLERVEKAIAEREANDKLKRKLNEQ
jgi:hypothetical protein